MSEEFLTIHVPESKTPKSTKRKSSVIAAQTHDQKYDPIYSMYEQYRQEIDQIKNRILNVSLDSLYQQIYDYFNGYHKKRQEAMNERFTTDYDNDDDDDDDEMSLDSVHNIIPTITLFTGINIKDYSNLSETLSNKLQESFTKYLFNINETNSQNIKNLLQSLFAQLKQMNEEFDGLRGKNLNTFRNFFDLMVATHEHNNKKAVVFVFKQFEIIHKETIESFISIVSCYIAKMPIYFLIEMSSQSNFLYEQLSGNLVSKLCIKKLHSITPDKFMDKFLTQIFINNSSTFKLSGHILKYLFDSYNLYNFSITHFIHSLNYCLYDHLKQNKLNGLFIFNRKSFKNDYEALLHDLNESNEFNHKEFDDKKPKNLIDQIECVQKTWIQYHNQYSLVCKFVYEILRHFPCENDNDKCLTNVCFSRLYIQLSNLIEKKFTESDQFQNLKRLLYVASLDTLNDIVSKIINIVNVIASDAHVLYDKEFIQDLSRLMEILKALRNPEMMLNNDDNDNDENKEVSPVKRRMSTRKTLALGLTDSSNLATTSDSTTSSKMVSFRKRKTLSNVTTATNSYTNVRNRFIDWLTQQFSIYFDKDYATQMSHSKYFCYSNLACLKQRVFDVPRTKIHDALVNPFDKYLTKSVCDLNEAPVLSNIYRIYLECGQMINLYDWLQAFAEKMENADLCELSESKRKLMQALFFRSITELQFMGFIKQTNRKVDHVLKLTNIGYTAE